MSQDQILVELIEKKYVKLKTLVLKLRSNDQLEQFVEKMMGDLQDTLLFSTEHCRKQIKQSRPQPDDPHYQIKIILYRELLEQMVNVIHQLQDVIYRILDQFHSLMEELWIDITTQNGENLHRLIDEHQRQTELLLRERWINYIDQLQNK